MNKHNLVEYGIAKEAVEELPAIKKILDKTYVDLYNHASYLCAQHVLDAIADSLQMIDRQYKYYKGVVEKKGKE